MFSFIIYCFLFVIMLGLVWLCVMYCTVVEGFFGLGWDSFS